MTQEKHGSLTKYLEDLKQKLAAKDVPLKHRNAPQEYRSWLQREVAKTSNRLETEAIVTPKNK